MERCRVRPRVEGVPERRGAGIVLAEGTDSEEQADRAHHGAGGVEGAVHRAAARPWRRDDEDRAVRVDVVGAVLGVVFEGEEREGPPRRGAGQARDHAAQGEIVVGHHRARREGAAAAALGVVARQVQDHEVGEAALPVPAVHRVGEQARAHGVRDRQVPARVVGRGNAFEPADLRVVVVARIRIGELAEVDDPQPLAPRRVPEIRVARVLHVLAVLEVVVAAAAVDRRPRLLVVVARECTRGPLVAVGADLAVHIEVVAQHPAPGEGVGVGRDAVVEDRERRIAVPRRHVAEYLVVGAVLTDDVNDMPNSRTDGLSDRRTDLRVRVRAQRVHLPSELGQRGRVRHRDDRH